MSVLRIIERDITIAYKVAYTRIPGSDHTCALFLSQVAYWCGNSKDGWVWLTHDRLEAQTGMGRKSQDRAASFWISVGVMQKTLRGLPAKIHYSVDFDRLEALLLTTKVVQNGQAELSEVDKHSIGDSLEILSCPSASQQQPESASGISTLAPSQTLAQTPDAPLPSGATPHPHHCAAPPSPRTKARFIPPTEAEWLAYCEETFPTWRREAALAVLSYYESVSWKGKSNWKACAKTCFYRAKPTDIKASNPYAGFRPRYNTSSGKLPPMSDGRMDDE